MFDVLQVVAEALLNMDIRAFNFRPDIKYSAFPVGADKQDYRVFAGPATGNNFKECAEA